MEKHNERMMLNSIRLVTINKLETVQLICLVFYLYTKTHTQNAYAALPLSHRNTWTIPKALSNLSSFIIIMSTQATKGSDFGLIQEISKYLQKLSNDISEAKITCKGKAVHHMNLYAQPIPVPKRKPHS